MSDEAKLWRIVKDTDLGRLAEALLRSHGVQKSLRATAAAAYASRDAAVKLLTDDARQTYYNRARE